MLAICVLFVTCKKGDDDGGTKPPPAPRYTCYLNTSEDWNHVVTNRYTYNTDHFLTQHEVFQGGLPYENWLYYKNDQENWIREDHFVHDAGGYYYQSYRKFYFNNKGKVDSSVTYGCVDCEKLNPTKFERNFYWTYSYDDSLLLTKAQYYNYPHAPGGYTLFEYDSHGRMAKESSFMQDGTLDFYYQFAYTNIDSLTTLTGEPSAIDKGMFGYSRVYRELFTTYYFSTTGKTQVVQWLNERNPDGYLNSSANADLASLQAFYKYACFKD